MGSLLAAGVVLLLLQIGLSSAGSFSVNALLLFGAAVTGVWGLIEGILILTGSIAVDGKGVPIKKDL